MSTPCENILIHLVAISLSLIYRSHRCSYRENHVKSYKKIPHSRNVSGPFSNKGSIMIQYIALMVYDG